MPKSKEQPLNIGEILKAYFTMRSRSGYTENTGDGAHDLLLSKERAEATKKAVASMRIDPSRIDVERYSSQHPVASNAENRARFSLRVVLELWRGRQRPVPPERRRWQSKRRVPYRRRVLVRGKCQRLP